jgi:predicted transcriptional regulator
MATTTRLPDDLKAEAERYAHDLGISLNALLAVSLRDYLDRRKHFEWKAKQAAVAEMRDELARSQR